jgi:ATP-dependent exoDNAse (exonuclease V) beta subunit
MRWAAPRVGATRATILHSQIESATDDSEFVEVYNTGRHFLYVAGTRARDFLMVSCVRPRSEFLENRALEAARRIRVAAA